MRRLGAGDDDSDPWRATAETLHLMEPCKFRHRQASRRTNHHSPLSVLCWRLLVGLVFSSYPCARSAPLFHVEPFQSMGSPDGSRDGRQPLALSR